MKRINSGNAIVIHLENCYYPMCFQDTEDEDVQNNRCACSFACVCTLKEGYKLQLSENKVLRKIHKHKKDE
jgi:hypothetical protein